jgi:LPPG:FO 2-phospho-L-lactate transferase
LRAVVVAPSNPYVSIAPILRVPAIRRWFASRRVPVVAVSPIVGGAALKGPAAKMMRELGAEASALGVVRHYRGTVDGWVIDRIDTACAPAIEASGHAVRVAATIMSDPHKSERLAREVIGFARSLARGRTSA